MVWVFHGDWNTEITHFFVYLLLVLRVCVCIYSLRFIPYNVVEQSHSSHSRADSIFILVLYVFFLFRSNIKYSSAVCIYCDVVVGSNQIFFSYFLTYVCFDFSTKILINNSLRNCIIFVPIKHSSEEFPNFILFFSFLFFRQISFLLGIFSSQTNCYSPSTKSVIKVSKNRDRKLGQREEKL